MRFAQLGGCSILLLSCACATALSDNSGSIQIIAKPDSVEVWDHSNRLLGIARDTEPLRVTASGSSLSFRREGWESDVSTVERRPSLTALLNLGPVAIAGAGLALDLDHRAMIAIGVAGLAGALVDLVSGAAWRPHPGTIRVALEATPAPPGLEDAVVAETLLRLATAAQNVGCHRLFSDAWLEERHLYTEAVGASPALPPAVVASIDRQVETSLVELQMSCDEVIFTAVEVEDSFSDLLTPSELQLTEPIYFDFDSASIPMDDLSRLRGLAQRFANSEESFLLVVEGFADPSGNREYNRVLALARAQAVMTALHGFGLSESCCIVRSYGSDPIWQAAPGASGEAAGAPYNRRVTFSLRHRPSDEDLPR
jgi:outer membrane protein OmpA-like peptidoglycan-associated protein